MKYVWWILMDWIQIYEVCKLSAWWFLTFLSSLQFFKSRCLTLFLLAHGQFSGQLAWADTHDVSVCTLLLHSVICALSSLLCSMQTFTAWFVFMLMMFLWKERMMIVLCFCKRFFGCLAISVKNISLWNIEHFVWTVSV